MISHEDRVSKTLRNDPVRPYGVNTRSRVEWRESNIRKRLIICDDGTREGKAVQKDILDRKERCNHIKELLISNGFKWENQKAKNFYKFSYNGINIPLQIECHKVTQKGCCDICWLQTADKEEWSHTFENGKNVVGTWRDKGMKGRSCIDVFHKSDQYILHVFYAFCP